MTEFKPDTRRVIRVSRRKLIIVVTILVLAGLGMIVYSVLSGKIVTNYVEQSIPPTGINRVEYDQMMKSSTFPRNQQPLITDTREFLKTNYSAFIKTRNVPETMTNVKNIVKGTDGRIDGFYSSDRHGRIDFVVAKSRFEEFRTQIEGLTYAKLYTENISSQNLLSQKQGIEAQAENISNTLEGLRKQKADLVSKHTQTVQAINRELTRIRVELADISITMSEEVDPAIIASLRNQENAFLVQESTQKQKLSAENSNYTIQSQNLDRLISDAINNLTNISEQDSQFMANIETVNGAIYVNWVSLWQLAKIFSPIPPIIVIIILVIIIWIFLSRRGYIPKIILE